MTVSSRRRAWRVAITALEGDWKEKGQLPDGEQERVAAKPRQSSMCPSLHDVQQINQDIIDAPPRGYRLRSRAALPDVEPTHGAVNRQAR